MKTILSLLTISLLCLTLIPSWAAIEKTQLNAVQTTTHTSSVKTEKPTFFQKLALKVAEKRFHKLKKNESEFKDDKLANAGFWSVIGSIGLSLISSLAQATILSTIAGIVLLVGFILCVIALVGGNLSPKGRRQAIWGAAIFGVLLLLGLILLLIIAAAFA